MPAAVVPSAALVTLMIESHQVPPDTDATTLTQRLIDRHVVPTRTTDATVLIELRKRHKLPQNARARLSQDEWASFASV